MISECHQFRIVLMENSESGWNPERYRHCMRGGTAHDESQSLGVVLRRLCGMLMKRKSGDLLRLLKSICSRVMEKWAILLRKNGSSSHV